jgi:hypothetical protein
LAVNDSRRLIAGLQFVDLLATYLPFKPLRSLKFARVSGRMLPSEAAHSENLHPKQVVDIQELDSITIHFF